MTETKKPITDTTVFTPDCHERFLQAGVRWSAPLDDRGVILAGLSCLHEGAILARQNKAHHSLLCCLQGEARLETESKTVDIRPGDLWLLSAHAPFRYTVDDFWELAWFHISKNNPKHYSFSSELQIVHNQKFDDLAFAMDRYTLESCSDNKGSKSIAYALSLLIGEYLDRLAFGFQEGGMDSDRSRQFHTLWQEVRKNPSHPWTTENLAKRVGLSPGHFRAQVKEIESDTAMNIVTALRMEQAKILLRRSDYKLSTVAYLVGYNSPFSFSRAFKRVVGVCPKEFKEQISVPD